MPYTSWQPVKANMLSTALTNDVVSLLGYVFVYSFERIELLLFLVNVCCMLGCTYLIDSWKASALEPTKAAKTDAKTVPSAFDISSSTV